MNQAVHNGRGGFFVLSRLKRQHLHQAWRVLRYHLDDNSRKAHLAATARWIVTHPERSNKTTIRHSERVLTGQVRSHGRWRIAGSRSSQFDGPGLPAIAPASTPRPAERGQTWLGPFVCSESFSCICGRDVPVRERVWRFRPGQFLCDACALESGGLACPIQNALVELKWCIGCHEWWPKDEAHFGRRGPSDPRTMGRCVMCVEEGRKGFLKPSAVCDLGTLPTLPHPSESQRRQVS